MEVNNISIQPAEMQQYHQAVNQESGNMRQSGENTSGSKYDATEAFINAIEKTNHIENGRTECQFSIHEKTNQIMIKIVDQETREVLKEIPSEKILDMVAKMCDLAGVFIDEKR